MSCSRTQQGDACGDRTQDFTIRSQMLYYYATVGKESFHKSYSDCVLCVSALSAYQKFYQLQPNNWKVRLHSLQLRKRIDYCCSVETGTIPILGPFQWETWHASFPIETLDSQAEIFLCPLTVSKCPEFIVE